MITIKEWKMVVLHSEGEPSKLDQWPVISSYQVGDLLGFSQDEFRTDISQVTGQSTQQRGPPAPVMSRCQATFRKKNRLTFRILQSYSLLDLIGFKFVKCLQCHISECSTSECSVLPIFYLSSYICSVIWMFCSNGWPAANVLANVATCSQSRESPEFPGRKCSNPV